MITCDPIVVIRRSIVTGQLVGVIYRDGQELQAMYACDRFEDQSLISPADACWMIERIAELAPRKETTGGRNR